MKDPAFLFYPNDWMGGTMGMTFEQKGAYIELLMMQFNHGKFSEAQAKQVLSICFANVWDTVKLKFRTDGNVFWNERLRLECEKRAKFSESRRKNASNPKKTRASAEHMLPHMENENINEIENYISKDIEHLKEYIAGKNFKFSGVEPANWQTEIAKFLSDKRYIVDFSVKNNIPFDDVEKRMVDFVAKLNSKMDYKDFPAMKVHFANSYQFHVVNGGKSKKETSSKGFHEVPKNIDYENLEGAWNQ